MLPKKRRIPRSEFHYILSHSKRINSLHFILYICPFESKNQSGSVAQVESRFAFSVSKKIFKNATKRNLSRRRGYCVIHKIINTIYPGYFFFFSYKKSLQPLSFEDVQNEITHLLASFRVVVL